MNMDLHRTVTLQKAGNHESVKDKTCRSIKLAVSAHISAVIIMGVEAAAGFKRIYKKRDHQPSRGKKIKTKPYKSGQRKLHTEFTPR